MDEFNFKDTGHAPQIKVLFLPARQITGILFCDFALLHSVAFPLSDI
jgi:hypothetical protein